NVTAIARRLLCLLLIFCASETIVILISFRLKVAYAHRDLYLIEIGKPGPASLYTRLPCCGPLRVSLRALTVIILRVIILTPLLAVSGHFIEPIPIRFEALYRHGRQCFEQSVSACQILLAEVGQILGGIIAPGISLAYQTATGSVFPFGFCRESLTCPLGV